MPYDFDALIVGAGFSGLYQLHSLRDQLGMKVRVLEAGAGVGGTWYWNRYPGARCDSESHSYNYFFSKDLIKNWEWSERYPGQAEVLRYLNYVADTLSLRDDIQLNTRVVGAAFDDELCGWRVTTQDGQELTSQFLISAVGCLSSANIPSIPGLDDFRGQYYHTGTWPHEGVNFAGKRVGQIGTGSTGIQCVPVIAAEADHLTLFQRTANFSIPAHNGPMDPDLREDVKKNPDFYKELVRSTTNGHPFRIAPRKVSDVDEQEQTEIYEKAWAKGGLRFRAAFEDLLSNQEANDTAADFIKAKIKEIVKDPETAEKLADIDHPFATKRPPIDTHYFESFNRDNVSLVDVRARPITHIDETGIATTDGHHEVDIIVFATGFDAMTGSLLRMNITGSHGLSLAEAWSEGPKTYLGLQVAGFPNMFTLTGPGSPSVLCNMPVAIEQHVEWVTQCISFMKDNDLGRIEPKAHQCEEWAKEVNKAADATLLPKAKHSWYLGANVPGKPRMFMPYAGGFAHYASICDQIAQENYKGFSFSRRP